MGDYAAGDILIRDGGIAQVAEDLVRRADGAVVIDAAGTIAFPRSSTRSCAGPTPTLGFGGHLRFTAFSALSPPRAYKFRSFATVRASCQEAVAPRLNDAQRAA